METYENIVALAEAEWNEIQLLGDPELPKLPEGLEAELRERFIKNFVIGYCTEDVQKTMKEIISRI
jgi:hypothetical protein